MWVAFVFVVLVVVQCARSADTDYLIWIPRNITAAPLYRFTKYVLSKHPKVGYIDRTGKVVIPPVLPYRGGNYGGEFHDGLLEIGVSDGIYVDETGKKVITRGLYRGWDFSDGLAVAMEKENGKWGYINTKGDFAITPRFASSKADYVWPFEEGFAKIEVSGKFGYIDHSGRFVIPPQFLYGDSFHEGMARVVVEIFCISAVPPEHLDLYGETLVAPMNLTSDKTPPECKYAFIDTSGRIISDQRYDDARPFGEGLAPVLIGQKWGYVDKTGRMRISPRFQNADSFSDGLALVSDNGRFGFVDRQGAYVIEPQFKYAESFAEGLAVVSNGESDYWYIDHSGREAISGKFALASSFFKGLAHVKLLDDAEPHGKASSEGTFAYIDRTGKRVFEYNP